MSESSQEQAPDQAFGAPPGSQQWPQGGFGEPTGVPQEVLQGGPAPQAGQAPYGVPAQQDPSFNPQPYGQYPQQGYPQGGYPQQGYPQQGYPQAAYAGYAPTASSFPGSTAILLAISLIAVIATGIIGIPSAVIAALSWREHSTDPAKAAKRTTTGWIVFAVNFAVGILVLIPFYIWASNNQ